MRFQTQTISDASFFKDNLVHHPYHSWYETCLFKWLLCVTKDVLKGENLKSHAMSRAS